MHCRLYIQDEIHTGTSIQLPSDQTHYLRNVMRLNVGDKVTLFNGKGGEYLASVESLEKNDSSLFVDSHLQISREMPCRVHIVQAACRSEKIELILQKATELGAASFHIVRSERSSLKLDGTKRSKKLERWQKIIIEAAEQSERTAVPEIFWHDKLVSVPATGLCFTLHPQATTTWNMQRENIVQSSDITLAIGPEGGWSPRDIEQLSSKDYSSLLFGPRVMRTETAAPALMAAIQSLLD